MVTICVVCKPLNYQPLGRGCGHLIGDWTPAVSPKGFEPITSVVLLNVRRSRPLS